MYDNVVIGYTVPVVVREEEAGNLTIRLMARSAQSSDS